MHKFRFNLRQLLFSLTCFTVIAVAYSRMGLTTATIKIDKMEVRSLNDGCVGSLTLHWRFDAPERFKTKTMKANFSSLQCSLLKPKRKAGDEIEFTFREFSIPFFTKDDIYSKAVDEIFPGVRVDACEKSVHNELRFGLEQMHNATLSGAMDF